MSVNIFLKDGSCRRFDDASDGSFFDIAKDLQDIREIDFNEYKSICKKIPSRYV